MFTKDKVRPAFIECVKRLLGEAMWDDAPKETRLTSGFA